MRTIKFRGRDKAGRWLYGDLMFWHGDRNDPWIQTGFENKFGTWTAQGGSVQPETVGQYTGLKDTEGMEIYEGDLVETFIGELKVVWSNHDGEAGFRLQDDGGSLFSIRGMEMTVKGNIHE